MNHRRLRRWSGGVVAVLSLLAVAACGSSESATPAAPPPSELTVQGGVTSAQLAEASRLVNVGGSPEPPPAAVVACVAHVVVQNPLLDQAANDIAQMPKDLREEVMFSYLRCGYEYILDTYMRFAPPGLNKVQLACIRSKFKELDVHVFSEVIVLDPDAGHTGPLLIQACKSGFSKSNPLLNSDGSLIDMGSS